MSVTIDASWLVAVILVAARLGVLFFATPMDAFGRLPSRIRVLFTMAFSIVLVTFLGLERFVEVESTGMMALAVLNELVVGLLLVFGFYCSLGMIMVAGKLIDFQTGFGAATLFNPGLASATPLVGSVLSVVAVFVFFAVDAHHMLFRGVVYAFEAIPPGQGVLALNMEAVVAQFGFVFTYGLAIAAPVIAGLLLLDVGIAVLSRTMPQMNVYFVILPLKIFLGLVLLALSLRYMTPVIERHYQKVFEYWGVLLVS